MSGELYRRTLDDECMTCGWSSLGGGPHEGCADPNVWTEESYSSATPADLVAHVVALPAEEARALLVALLRARPEEAVAAVDACKVARPWDDDRREPLNALGGPPVVEVVVHGEEAAECWVEWLYTDSLGTIADGESVDKERAEAAADAAIHADGWVLAGVTP